MKRVLCVGDACADLLIPYGHARNGREAKVGFAPGGTVANTASAWGAWGRTAPLRAWRGRMNTARK